uniref:Uncharacterized protein n=1 Tax=Arundo donax TaxID=35708 RepID=A0A0A9CCC8_ARUDO
MGSNEPLGAPAEVVDSAGHADPVSGVTFVEVLREAVGEETNTSTPPPTWIPPNGSPQEDGTTGRSEDKEKETSSVSGNKRKRVVISEDEALVFIGMTNAVKDMAGAIKATIHAEAHPDVYNAVMTLPSFTEDAILDALEWLYNNKAQSLDFVQMSDEHRHQWMNRWITKHYFNQ